MPFFIVKESYHHGKLSDGLALSTREELHVEEVFTQSFAAIRLEKKSQQQ